MGKHAGARKDALWGRAGLDGGQRETGRYVISVLRHNHLYRFAQITFWEPPAPRCL